jgi:protein-L-isoaspartate(D-aspartate) O-methyltransferase
MGIVSEQVLQAMRCVPRHKFVRAGLEHQAYDEKALPIGFDQTISHPYTVAVMTQVLDVKNGDKVLEIGTGSGYQAAVLCEIGIQVYTIEKIQELGQSADRLLKSFGYHYALRIGDGTLGWQTYAPYTAIIVTAGAPVMPENLMDQLRPEGRLLIPVGDENEQILTLYVNKEAGFRKFELEKLSFVPLVGKQGWK